MSEGRAQRAAAARHRHFLAEEAAAAEGRARPRRRRAAARRQGETARHRHPQPLRSAARRRKEVGDSPQPPGAARRSRGAGGRWWCGSDGAEAGHGSAAPPLAGTLGCGAPGRRRRRGSIFLLGMKFTGSPIKLKVSQGQPVKLNCSLEGMEDPEMLWIKDGAVVQSVDQVYIPVDEEHWIGFLSLKSVERTDSGKYWCQVENGGKKEESQQVWLIVEAMPLPPLNVTVSQVTSSNASVVWVPGFDGRAPLHSCTLQVAESPDGQEVSTEVAPVPPFAYGVQGLKHSTNYSVRVQCSNEMGSSPFTDRVYFQTLELAPSSTPQNIHVIQRDPGLVLEWEGVAPDVLKENVLGYRLEWIQDNITQGEMIVQDTKANLTTWNPLKDLIIRVCVLNSAGCGPWSDFFLLEAQEVMGGQRQPPYGTSWVPVALGILTALVTAVALALILLRKRRKETRFGHAFGSVVGRGDPAVHFRAARSFNREGPELIEATLESVGISDELKTKLKDVLIQEQQFTLGRMLGKGEFGSVREALLKLDDGSFQKVAVKMLKADIFTSTDIEEFLREAACMKEFDHPHVTKLIGVSLRSRPKGRLPIPMVILPFMKHGDLHAFLLMSRIGENPFNLPVQTLLKFMIDIASGMEYLSSKNFIHRDLAARNCMLDENMNVSVADFGLSKKIYSGDYYRQGCASKLPVKWLALESLADNLYTTHSDVWAFGVTMWEIVTRGQTPYAGIENAEIYNYLISGNRLKQPPECLEDVYDLMCRCWHPEPKLRPSFAMLRYQLEMIRGRMSTLSASQDPLYVNIGKDKEASGSDPALHASFANTDGDETVAGAAAAVTSDYRYIMSPLCLGDDAEAARHPDGQEGEDKSLLYELETEGEKSC
nr:tyrosine-protein kinase receptor TYRO3 isoform X4 [Anas platyrhynchos]